VENAIERAFGDKDYLRFGWNDNEATEWDAQKSIFDDLQKKSQSASKLSSSRAFFELSIAYSIGFGVQMNIEMALKCVTEAARRGYLPAKAVFYPWHIAHSQTIAEDDETQLDWLYDASIWGSVYAAQVLQHKNRAEHEGARQMFHRRGGYNQYFYDNDPPAHIESRPYLVSLMTSRVDVEFQHLKALLQSAAIYGDAALAQHLLRDRGMDPNLTTDCGESLLLLCCKGGHVNVLYVCIPSFSLTCADLSRRSSKPGRVRNAGVMMARL